MLETLTPAERLAFVLHDMFAVPFDEIGRSSGAARTRPASSRAALGGGCAARRERGGRSGPPARVVEAFLAASRGGDFEALIAVLDPDVVFRVDTGPGSRLARPPVEGASRSPAGCSNGADRSPILRGRRS